MNKRFLARITIFLLLCISTELNAQKIDVNAKNLPFNKLLIDLRDQYNLQVSFDDDLLSNCIINKSQTFDSPEDAFNNLIQECNIAFKQKGKVFLFYKKPEENVKSEKKKFYYFSGKITDHFSGEELPFSNIVADNSQILTDANGVFSVKSEKESINIRASYLGYYISDTLVNPNSNLEIKLKPSVVGLEEIVVISSDSNTFEAQITQKPSTLKINYQQARFLPGNNDNTIFNLIRLQPGILAAGEQTKDFIIWGSYGGQTQILFDGITIFNIGSYNENIGIINPLIVKDIEIHKAGYNVQIGDRVGGVVNMTSKSGEKDIIHSALNINNQTASAIISIPTGKRSAIQGGFRTTFYKAYKNKESFLNTPDHKFSDFNFKYTGNSKSGNNYQISIIGSSDNFQETVDVSKENFKFENSLNGNQIGASALYSKKWKKIGSTNFTYSNSFFNSEKFTHLLSQEDSLKPLNDKNFSQNTVGTSNFRIDHSFTSSKHHSIQAGIGITNYMNKSAFGRDSTAKKRDGADKFNRQNILNLYIKDRILLSKNISIQPGIRINHIRRTQQTFTEPRIEIDYKLNSNIHFHSAAGIYNQFLSQAPIFDPKGNALSQWIINDGKRFKVLQGEHYILGNSYSIKKTTLTTNLFYKTLKNMSFLIPDENKENLNLIYGNGISYGLDILIKQKVSKHDFWISYTLGEVKEEFESTIKYALQDQKHELKTAGMFNFSPFYFSYSYVFGSGFPQPFYIEKYSTDRETYSRFDIAFLYKFNPKKYKMETGVSILNVFNTENPRFNSFSEKGKFQQTGTSFSPSVFLNINF